MTTDATPSFEEYLRESGQSIHSAWLSYSWLYPSRNHNEQLEEDKIALQAAVKNSDFVKIRSLHRNYPDLQDNDGTTALHLACFAGNLNLVCDLLVYTLSIYHINVENKEHFTPLELAESGPDPNKSLVLLIKLHIVMLNMASFQLNSKNLKAIEHVKCEQNELDSEQEFDIREPHIVPDYYKFWLNLLTEQYSTCLICWLKDQCKHELKQMKKFHFGPKKKSLKTIFTSYYLEHVQIEELVQIRAEIRKTIRVRQFPLFFPMLQLKLSRDKHQLVRKFAVTCVHILIEAFNLSNGKSIPFIPEELIKIILDNLTVKDMKNLYSFAKETKSVVSKRKNSQIANQIKEQHLSQDIIDIEKQLNQSVVLSVL